MKDGPYAYRGEGGITFNVYLPELTDKYEGDELTPEMLERVVEAAQQAMPRRVEIYLDGEDMPPVVVEMDPWSIDDKHEWSING